MARDGRAQKLVNCDALASVREYTLTDVRRVCKGLGTVNVLPGNAYEIEIRFQPLGLGNPRVTIAFEFEDGESGISYHIVRFLLANVTDADAELLKPTAPYERPPVKEKPKATEVIEGIPPPQSAVRISSILFLLFCLSFRSSYNRLKLERSLDDYLIPPNLRYCVTKEEIEGDYKERVEAELAAANYGEKFKALLHVEELQMEVDIRHYDMENAELQFISGRYLNMKVFTIRHGGRLIYDDPRCLVWRRIGPPFSKAIGCMHPLLVVQLNMRDSSTKFRETKKRFSFALQRGNGAVSSRREISTTCL